jgi:hypothetical protein
MRPANSLHLAGAALLSLATFTGVVVSACSSDNGSNPTPVIPVGDDGSTPDVLTTPDATGAVGDDGGGDAGSDAPTDASAPPVDAAGCADAGCWSCAPTTTTQFLNHCTNSTCSPFSNTSRLPGGYDGGPLPALP